MCREWCDSYNCGQQSLIEYDEVCRRKFSSIKKFNFNFSYGATRVLKKYWWRGCQDFQTVQTKFYIFFMDKCRQGGSDLEIRKKADVIYQ